MNTTHFKNIDKIYVIGDLHGDIHIFLSFLKSIKLIKSYNYSDDYDAYKDSDFIKHAKTNIIFNNDLSKFTNSVIVQLGDIADGHNNCDKNNNKRFIMNDIAIFAIIDVINEHLKHINNFHFITIIGNHDFNALFYGYINKTTVKDDIGSVCGLDNTSSWPQYLLNYDEILIPNKENKERVIYYKINKRKDYLLNDYKSINNMYFIVKINNFVFSHNVFYQELINDLYKLLNNKIITNKNNLFNVMNELLNYCFHKVKKNNSIDDVDERFKNIIERIRMLISSRSLKHKIDNIIVKHSDDIAKDIMKNEEINYFVGHEIQNEIIKIKPSLFNLYIYYCDVGLSKSIKQDINLDEEFYYIKINCAKKTKKIKKCNNINCVDY